MSASTAYVLSTRPLTGSLIDEAAAKGVTIDVLPFIDIGLLEEETLASQLQDLIKKPLVAVFASTNAVTAIKGQEQPDWKIFCISGATQRAVAARFGNKTIAGVAGSAKELAEVIKERAEDSMGRELWFFCGDRRREELPETLRTAGWTVREIVVYRTILTPHKIVRTYDAIVFFSPSAVESFFSVNKLDPRIPLFAIGATTAAAIYEKCPNPVTVSEQPEEKQLIRQIIHRYDQTEK